LPDYTSLASALDNCGTATITQSPAAAAVISGTTTITLTANDGNGNTSTCQFDVVLNDGTAPNAVCQPISAYLNGAGTVTILASDLDGGSTDNCSGLTFTATQTTFTCADLGTVGVTLTVTDGNSNTANCVATVTVLDSVSPVAVCQNITVYLNGAGNVTINDADLDNGSTDNCGTVNFTASITSFTCAELGSNSVTLTVDDGNGNSSFCVGTVTVMDTVSPTITCPGNQTQFADASCDIALGDYTGAATANDNCGSVTVTQSPVPGTIVSGAGTVQTVTLTATDGSGNSAFCTFDVTVVDTILPTAVCQPITVYLNGGGTITIAPGDLDGGSSDNCGGVTFGASVTAFNCADLGTNSVTLTVTDGSSNTDACAAVVTILDTISPVVTCPGNQTENPDASCNFTLPDYTSLGSATDNCGGSPTITQLPAPTTVISGTTTITLTADDGNGNTSTCTFDVVLNDGTAPTAVCQNISIYLDAAGNATIVGADLDGGSTDNCSGITFTASQTAFTCTDLGPNNITMTATDGNSNTANCVSVVTVLDTIAPVMTCPGNQVEPGDALCQGILGDYTGITTAIDICDPAPVITQSPLAGTTFTGTQVVWLYGTDADGNVDSCSITVSVTDINPPTITCPADQNVDFSASCDYTLLDYTAMATTADNCGSVTVTQAPASGTVITVSTPIWLYADDGNGNIDSCAFNVIPADNTAPSIACPADQNVSFSASCDYTLLDYTSTATTSDNCSGAITVTQSPASGTVVTASTAITLYGDDGNGNIDSCSFNVIPADTTAPIAVCQDLTVYLDASGGVTIAASELDGGSTDECGVPSFSIFPSVFTCSEVGVNVVVLTVTDGAGNSSTCNSNLTVMDTITPTIVCPGDQNVSFASTCDYTLIDYTALATVTENCTATVTQSPASGTVITASTVVTLTADDGNGNTATCTFNVIPADTDAPVVTCPIDETVILDANCEVVMADYTLTSTITDNCDATPTVVQTPAAGTIYTAEGTTDVTIVVTDTSGNVDSCSLVVTIAIDAASGCNTDIIVSNLLSPNGDGKNDFWIIHDPVDIAGCDVLVYNRWGQQVFSSKNYNNDWDGTFNGEPLPDGSYYYVIQCDGSVKEKGALTILRLKK
jgi:gliding motility-associated-like protein